MNNNLALLANFLELNVPPEKFDIGSWRYGRNFNTSDQDLLSSCGTTGCALGWGALMPELRAQGLVWQPIHGQLIVSGWPVNYETRDRLVPLFDLPVHTITWLFFPSSYTGIPSLDDVIARMRHVIEGGVPGDYQQ